MRDGAGIVLLGLVDPAQIGVGTPAEHVVVGLVGAGLGQELERQSRTSRAAFSRFFSCSVWSLRVAIQVGQAQVIRGVDIQGILNLLGDRLLLVGDRRRILLQPELDVCLDRFIDLTAELLDPGINQGELAIEQKQGRLDRLDEPWVFEQAVRDLVGQHPEVDSTVPSGPGLE